MDDQRDDKLKQRMKEVFDDYDDASADEGWLLLREKFPEQKRRRAMLWLWPAAAVILLFLGLAIWMYGINNKRVDNKKTSYRIKEIKPSLPALQQQKTIIAYQKKADIKYKGIQNSAYKTAVHNRARIQQLATNPGIIIASKQNSMITKQAVPVNSLTTNSWQTVIAPKTNQLAAMLADSAKTSSKPNIPRFVVNVQQKATMPDTATKQIASVNPKTTKTIEDLFAADQGKTDGDMKVNSDKKVRFGVYAATYFNYAKGSNNQVNVGAGFTADIALTGNLKLVTGLSINQNSFAYNNGGDVSPSFPAPNLYGNNGSQNGAYTQDASLVGLDIPLNLKYVLNSRKNQFYVLAGVGSGTFINESYSYLNTDGSVAASQSSGKGFNDFYFARTLNMALGVGYPLGKDQLVIEPFVKYPLQGLGAEQLRFGASGINLKFNFSIKK